MSQVLRELLYGRHAHTDSLACVDVPADVAGQLLEWSSHSIWQLVWHMDFWMDHELTRIEGLPALYPEHARLSWPSETPPSVDTWGREIARFGQLLARLAQHAGDSAEQLARTVSATDRSEAEHVSSLEAVLWQTIVHNSYHIGQVVTLRRALGVWPPESGSDTW
jgi:uncharacterized damage-inducible protein DinB